MPAGPVRRHLMRHRIRGERHDGRTASAARRLGAADRPRGGRPVHDRHLDVEEDEVPLAGLPPVDRLLAVAYQGCVDANPLKHRREDQPVHLVIFRGQDAYRYRAVAESKLSVFRFGQGRDRGQAFGR